MGRGGIRPNSGRKSKADEIKLIERMDNVALPDEAFEKLWSLVLEGNIQALKLWLAYRFGQPLKSVELQTQLTEPFKPPIIKVVVPSNAKSLQNEREEHT